MNEGKNRPQIVRCSWADSNERMSKYHDREWGVPLHEDEKLFEMLCLEGAQAGLSWQTILNKRAHYREVFDGFDAEKMAQYDANKIASLLSDPGIVRNRLKVNAFIVNAQQYLRIKKEWGTFDRYIWQFVQHTPIINAWDTMKDVPVTTPESDAMSKALKKEGFKFVGSTICYAYMQAVGMVNDHLTTCDWRSKQ